MSLESLLNWMMTDGFGWRFAVAFLLGMTVTALAIRWRLGKYEKERKHNESIV